jgi:hypothetical protein
MKPEDKYLKDLMLEYGVRPCGYAHVRAEKVGPISEIIQGMIDRKEFSNQNLVELARSQGPKGPLYDQFTWDNTEGGDLLRQREAQELVRSLRLKGLNPDGTPFDIAAFPAVQDEAGQYVRTSAADALAAAVAGSPAEQEGILVQALMELERFIVKHETLEGVSTLCADLRKILNSHRAVRKK